MTPLERVFVWTGGVLFVASLAYAAWWFAVSLARATPFAGWQPLAADALLFSVFALHHSLLARSWVKRALARVVADRLLRSIYVWTASALLFLVCLLWQPIGGHVYQVSGWPRSINATAQLGGLLLIVLSVRAIDALELAGIRRDRRTAQVQIAGPYRLVRHPLYLGWMLIGFGTAHMTGDRLAFAVISSIYLLLAIPWEERSLVTQFGARYQSYRRTVRWRVVPFVY